MLLVLTVVGAGLLGGPAAATTSAGGRLRPDLAGTFIGGINQARASHGRSRLSIDSTLTAVAQGWALSMSKTGALSHNPRLASSVRGWHFLGENVGVGYSVASLQAAFWASAPHRSNLLDSDFTRIGVGVVEVGGGKLWVVEDFSRPAGATTPRERASSPHRARADTRPATHSSGQRVVRQPLAEHHGTAEHHGAAAHSGVDALAAACARQAARLFRARHWLRQDVAWSWLRTSLRT